jgi:hypothetical protein
MLCTFAIRRCQWEREREFVRKLGARDGLLNVLSSICVM